MNRGSIAGKPFKQCLGVIVPPIQGVPVARAWRLHTHYYQAVAVGGYDWVMSTSTPPYTFIACIETTLWDTWDSTILRLISWDTTQRTLKPTKLHGTEIWEKYIYTLTAASTSKLTRRMICAGHVAWTRTMGNEYAQYWWENPKLRRDLREDQYRRGELVQTT